MNLLTNKERQGNYNEETRIFLQLINQPLATRLDFVGSLEAPPFFSWEIVLRDIMLFKNDLPIINSGLEARIKKILNQWPEEKLRRLLQDISRARNLLKHNINKKLILENLFINF